MHGRNNGKKLLTVRIVKHSFEIIHLLTGENPLQVVVNAIINSGPREDSTRIGRAGTVRRQAVDVSPLRRVNQVSTSLKISSNLKEFLNLFFTKKINYLKSVFLSIGYLAALHRRP